MAEARLSAVDTSFVGRLSWPLFAVASAAIGAVHVIMGPAIPGFGTVDSVVGQALAILLFVSAALAARNVAHLAALVLALVWTAIATLDLGSPIADPSSLTNWVAFVEAGCFAIMAWNRAELLLSASLHRRVLLIAAATLLILFGSIHLVEHAALTALVPGWMPFRTVGPLITGALQLMLGALLLATRWRRASALAAAALFATWLPLVHAERLLNDPASAFEWGFALVAIGLVGVMLELARHSTASGRHRREVGVPSTATVR